MERVLIAEDDRMVQKALLRLFEHEKLIVDIASDGKSAMEAFHPQCGFVHRPADLLRVGWDTLQCKGCQREFSSKADPERKEDEEGER